MIIEVWVKIINIEFKTDFRENIDYISTLFNIVVRNALFSKIFIYSRHLELQLN